MCVCPPSLFLVLNGSDMLMQKVLLRISWTELARRGGDSTTSSDTALVYVLVQYARKYGQYGQSQAIRNRSMIYAFRRRKKLCANHILILKLLYCYTVCASTVSKIFLFS